MEVYNSELAKALSWDFGSRRGRWILVSRCVCTRCRSFMTGELFGVGLSVPEASRSLPWLTWTGVIPVSVTRR